MCIRDRLTALQNKLKAPSATNVTGDTGIACGGDCRNCSGSACKSNKELIDAVKAEAAAKAAAEKAAKIEAAKKAKEKGE